MNAEVGNVLLAKVAALLVVVVFVGANEHFEVVHLFRRIQTLH